MVTNDGFIDVDLLEILESNLSVLVSADTRFFYLYQVLKSQITASLGIESAFLFAHFSFEMFLVQETEGKDLAKFFILAND